MTEQKQLHVLPPYEETPIMHKAKPGESMTDKDFASYVKEIRHLAQNEFDRMTNYIEENRKFPQDFFPIAIKHDLYRFALPKQYGGWGLSEKQILQVQEEFSRTQGGIRMHLHHASDMNWRILDNFGSQELRDKYMNKFQDKSIYANFALTEKSGGTGADLHTLAVKDGDDWVINGEKTLISHADVADFTYLIVVTDPEKKGDERLSAFFVPTNTPGFEANEMPLMMGCRGAGHADLKFTDMRVPDKYMLGKRGEGMKVAISSLSLSRAHIADSNLGMAQRMLEMSIAYSKDRVTFGKPLCKRQSIIFEIADMGAKVHALRLMLWDLAKDYDDGKDITKKASLAKLESINTVKLVSDYMLEIFGGIGYFQDNPYGPAERLYRDCRAMWLEEGPRSVQRLTAGRLLINDGGQTPITSL